MQKKIKITKPFSTAADYLQQYYEVKGYDIIVKRTENTIVFVLTKNSFYRRIIGMVPMISGLWTIEGDTVIIDVEAEMMHGYNDQINKYVERYFELKGYSFCRKIINKMTDPLFNKTFTEEFLLMSEGLLTG